MNRLGRVTLKSPQMVMINFGDNPTAIKAAKLALQKSNLNVNPQQEGVTLYVPVPKMTRERREYLASTAKAKMFNDYKEALNEVIVSRTILLIKKFFFEVFLKTFFRLENAQHSLMIL